MDSDYNLLWDEYGNEELLAFIADEMEYLKKVAGSYGGSDYLATLEDE